MVDNNIGIASTFMAYIGLMQGKGNIALQRANNLSGHIPDGHSPGPVT